MLEFFVSIFPGLAEKIAPHFGKVTFKISKTEMQLDKQREPDGEGGFNFGSYGNFTMEIINKKGVAVIIEDIHCVAYCGKKVLEDNISCNNRATYRKIAMKPIFDALSAITIPPKGIEVFDITIRPSRDLSCCDRIELSCKIGRKHKEIVYRRGENEK